MKSLRNIKKWLNQQSERGEINTLIAKRDE